MIPINEIVSAIILASLLSCVLGLVMQTLLGFKKNREDPPVLPEFEKITVEGLDYGRIQYLESQRDSLEDLIRRGESRAILEFNRDNYGSGQQCVGADIVREFTTSADAIFMPTCVKCEWDRILLGTGELVKIIRSNPCEEHQ